MISKTENSYNAVLNTIHGKPLSGRVPPDVPGWLGCLVEGSLEDLQLFGLDGCPRAASLRPARTILRLVLVVIRIAIDRSWQERVFGSKSDLILMVAK